VYIVYHSDLNAMKPMERQKMVQFRRITDSDREDSHDQTEEKAIITRVNDGKGVIEVFKTENMADHPLVMGPGYAESDIKSVPLNFLSKESSGIIGIQSYIL